MDILANNPFAALTLIAAPAVLTNASSVLVLSTSNRFARAIDRARAISAQVESGANAGDPLRQQKLNKLLLLRTRAGMLLTAMKFFYAALGGFAGASFVSVLGAGLATRVELPVLLTILGIALLAGVSGVGSLLYGCLLLVRETSLALNEMHDETELLVKNFGSLPPDSPAASGGRELPRG